MTIGAAACWICHNISLLTDLYPNNFKNWFWATRKLSKFADYK